MKLRRILLNAHRPILALALLGLAAAGTTQSSAGKAEGPGLSPRKVQVSAAGHQTGVLGNAVVELQRGNTDAAIRHYLRRMDDLLTNGDTVGYMACQTDLAQVYMAEGYYKEAISLLNETVGFYSRIDSPALQGINFNFIADAYLEMGEIPAGIKYARRARIVALSMPESGLAQMHEITAAALSRNGERVSGLTDTTTLATRSTRSEEPDYVGLGTLNGGIFQLFRGNLVLAQHYLNRVLQLPADPAIIRDANLYLSRCYQEEGEMDLAYSYLMRYAELNDSLLTERRQGIINDLLMRDSMRGQELRIIELRKDANIASISNRTQKIITIALLLGSVIILLGAYLTIRNYQHRLNSNQIIHKQSAEINQRRITDLENNLKIETMQSMILGQEAERERIAKDLHDSLGGLLSTVKLHFDAIQSQNAGVEGLQEYQKAYTLLDEACKEVRNISNNMQPSALLRMGVVPAINDLINRLESEEIPQIDFQHIGLNGKLDQTVTLNIYRIVQELLTNALKHANASQILIQLIEKDDELMVIVEDDGIGYDQNAVKQGMGTENISSRVNFLKGDLSIHSVIGEGTSTLINIPLS